VQRAVADLASRVTTNTAKRLCLPALRRWAELEEHPGQRLEARVGLVTRLGKLNTRYRNTYDVDECAEGVRLADELVQRVENPFLRAQVYAARASLLRPLKDLERALGDVGEAVALAPGEVAHRHVRMQILWDLGRRAEAAEEGLLYATTQLDASVQHDEAVCAVWTEAWDAGEPERALEAVVRITDRRRGYVGWIARLALLRWRAGERDEARRVLATIPGRFEERETRIDPAPKDALLRLARGEVPEGDVGRLLTAVVEVLEAKRRSRHELDTRP
jgi:hypothetical protein